MSERDWKETLGGLAAGIGAGAAFLFLLFGLKWNLLISVFLSLGIFTAVNMLCKPIRKIGNIDVEKLRNGKELERRLSEAKEDFISIEASMVRIMDSSVRGQARELKGTAESIIGYLEAHPERISLAGRFIDYYQDTASSILNRYVELQNSGLQTGEVNRLKDETLRALTDLNKAFKQQYQKLMKNEMLDMDAQLRLLEQIVNMEDSGR